ncbi:MAG: hypothetical protein ACTSQA_08025 [Candidatus Heimdallarchaeaceae archaeon]
MSQQRYYIVDDNGCFWIYDPVKRKVFTREAQIEVETKITVLKEQYPEDFWCSISEEDEKVECYKCDKYQLRSLEEERIGNGYWSECLLEATEHLDESGCFERPIRLLDWNLYPPVIIY